MAWLTFDATSINLDHVSSITWDIKGKVLEGARIRMAPVVNGKPDVWHVPAVVALQLRLLLLQEFEKSTNGKRI